MRASLDPKDVQFLEKRRWFATRWNVVGGLMFAGLVAFLAWMYWSHPRLVNPLHVVNELQAGTISQAMLETMAVLLPLVVSAIFAVLGVVILFAFAVFANERRYLKIISQLQRETE